MGFNSRFKGLRAEVTQSRYPLQYFCALSALLVYEPDTVYKKGGGLAYADGFPDLPADYDVAILMTSATNVSQYVLLGMEEEFGWVDMWSLNPE